MSRLKKRGMLVLGLVFLSLADACRSKHYAPEINFYFEINAPAQNAYYGQLSDYIKNHISFKKYTITNKSGHRWPFYRELNPDEQIASDSLMPPHWFLHKMVPKKPDQYPKVNEFMVKIDLSPHRDTIPNYQVNIFIQDSTGLVLSGTTGIHYFDSTEFSSTSSLNELFLKSIIRYSFK